MRAVYLSSAHDARLLELEGGPRPDDVIVSVGAGARYYAEDKGWDPRPIGAFLPVSEHDAARIASERAIAGAITALNTVGRAGPATPELNIGEYFRFDLHNIFGQVHFTRFLLRSVEATGVTSHKMYLNRRLEGRLVWGIRPHPDVLVSQVANRMFPDRLEVTGYDAETDLARLPLRSKLRQAVSAANVDRLYTLSWLREHWRARIRSGANAKRILVLGGQFDWKPVLASPEFSSRFRPTFLAASDYPVAPPTTQLRAAVADAVEGALGQEHGVAAWDARVLVNRIAGVASYLQGNYARLDKAVRKFDAVVTAVFVTPMQCFWGDLATRRGTPVVCYQHGEQALYPEIFEGRLEATYATHYFAYGSGVVSKYQDLINHSRLREVVVVGSTGKKPDYEGGGLVLYATGKWFKTARPFLQYPDPDQRLYQAHRTILRELEACVAADPRTEVVIKASNTALFNELPYKTPLTVDYSSRFTTLLKTARAVVLDTPATTAIEVAATTAPMFVLTGRTPWYDQPMTLLRKRAVVEDNADTLMKQLRAFLETGLYEADCKNREFADAYGGLGSRGDSILRVNQTLARIVT